jgi:hypothetical protein
MRAGQDGELGGLPRQHDRAQLALGGVGAGLAALELEHQVVAVRADLRRARREVLVSRGLQRREDLGLGRGPRAHRRAARTPIGVVSLPG